METIKKEGGLSMFGNTKLKRELNSVLLELEECRRVQGKLVDYIQGYRLQNDKALRREKGKVRPQEKKVFALEEVGYVLAELQNRVIDGEWS